MEENSAQGEKFVGPDTIHQPEPAVAQPMQEIVNQLDTALRDIGGLVSRTDQLEATVRRVDRQILMTIGILAVVLYGVKHLAKQLEQIEVQGGA
jgi:hypothetical protein